MSLLNNRSFLWWLLLAATIPSYVVLLREGFFPIHDDLPVVRQYAMEECVRDLQIPCRWTKELGNGYGYPLMNFYPPLPYIVGLIPRAMGLSYLDTVKLLFVLSLVLSVGFMARLGQVFFGRWGGLVAAIFYLYGPYQAVDLYVRGDLNELWAMAFLPAAMWFGYRLIKHPDFSSGIRFGLVESMIILSHLGMALIMTPVLVIWVLMWFFLLGVGRVKKLILPVMFSAVVTAGLSAFFIVPVFFEQRYVHVETLTIGYFNFLAHFVDLNQLFFSRFWGYGSSVFGPNDGLSFQVGLGHWLVGLIALGGVVFWSKRDRQRLGVVIFSLILFLVAAFMTHWKATAIWLHIPKLEFLQFPWRILSLVLFSISLITGSLVLAFREGWRFLVVVILLFLNLIFYAAYFQPLKWFSDRTDTLQFSGKIWQREIEAGIFDYLPKWSRVPPGGQALSDARLAETVPIMAESKSSKSQTYVVENKTSNLLPLVINTFYYPGWTAVVNNKVTQVAVTKGDLGLMMFEIPPGISNIVLRFTETPVRAISDLFSLVSIGGVVGWFIRRRFV